MTSARPPPPCACVEVVREPFACVSGAAGCVNVNRGPLVLRDGNPCGCLCVSFELTHLVLQFLCRAIHFQKSTPGGTPTDLTHGLLHEYMGHDVSNMRGFDSYRLLTLSLAALMTRISSIVIEDAHISAGAATLARTVPFWGRFRSP